MLNEGSARAVGAKFLQEVVAHFRMTEFIALDGSRYFAQWNIARFPPIARMKRPIQVDQEVEKCIIGPSLLGQMECVVGVWNILKRKTLVEPECEAMKHDSVLQFLGNILSLE